MRKMGRVIILLALAALALVLVMNLAVPAKKQPITTTIALAEEPWYSDDLLNVVSRTKEELVFRESDGAQLKVGQAYDLKLWPTVGDHTAITSISVVIIEKRFEQNSWHVRIKDFKPLNPYRGWVINHFEAE